MAFVNKTSSGDNDKNQETTYTTGGNVNQAGIIEFGKKTPQQAKDKAIILHNCTTYGHIQKDS